jgi:hypothetical protein
MLEKKENGRHSLKKKMINIRIVLAQEACNCSGMTKGREY